MSSNSNRKKKGLPKNEKSNTNKVGVFNKFNGLSKNKTFLGIVTVLVAFVLIAVVLDFSGLVGNVSFISNGNNNSSSGLPSFIKSSQFCNISSGNIGTKNQVNIYVMSWQGCPIGASESWMWYLYIKQTVPTLSNYAKLPISYTHQSSPADSFYATPGLLFNNYSFTNSNHVVINFHIDYVYPQFLPTPHSQAVVNAGISTLKTTSGFPTAAINDFVDYQTIVPTSVRGVTEPLANAAGHLTTCIIISGNNGTFFLEGGLYSFSYSPSIVNETSSYMLNNSASFPGIPSGESYLSNVIDLAQ